MTKTLSLVLALALTGIPAVAAEFAELPSAGSIRVETPMTAAAGLDTAALSVSPGLQLSQTALGVTIPEISATRMASPAAQTASARAQAQASPRAELASAEHGGALAFASIADGGRAARTPGDLAVAAMSAGLVTANLARYSEGGEGRYSPREPRSPENRSDNALTRAWEWVKAVPDGWKIGVAAAAIIGGTIFGFYEHSKAQNEMWLRSKSESQIVQIEKARRAGEAFQSAQDSVDGAEAQALLETAQAAQARQQRMDERIAAAVAAKHKTVDDKTHDSIKKARELAAFDGLAWSRATIAHNFASANPKTRVGEQTPRRWTGREEELEKNAIDTKFEGFLALSLKDLHGEVGREKAAAGQIDGQLKNYDKQVPALFGGKMAEDAKKGKADLKDFQDREIGPEEGLWAAKNGAMRGRVSDRLYSEREDYRTHRDHRDRLTTLFDAKVDPAYKTASGIDSDLSGMISHRNAEAFDMTLASLHTHDYAGESCDSDGKNCHSVYEDNSGIYRAMAAGEASAAASDARSANAGLERLKPMVSALYADKTLAQEQLIGLLPKVQGHAVGEGGFDVFGDLLLHPLFGIFGGLSSASSGESARSSFAPVLGALRAVDGEVAGRRDGEINWVEGNISRDLDGQMEKARGGFSAGSDGPR